jgi:ABC-2 type transport system permease protein
MRRIIAQVKKELIQIRRDRTALALAIVLPLILVTLLGNAISLTVTDMAIVVQDLDQTPTSRQYIDAYRTSLTFRVVSLAPSASPQLALLASRARAALIVPEHFERDIQRGRNVEVQMLVDATDANTANVIRGAVGSITRAFTQGMHPQAASGAPVQPQIRLWFNPGRKSTLYIGPGAFVVALSLLPPLLMALAMTREKDGKTILQVYVSGITAREYLLGKILAYYLLVATAWSLAFLLVTNMMGLHLVGDPTPFLAGSLAFMFATVAFGAMIGVRAPDQATSIQMVQLVAFVLAFLLSGFIYPLSNVPPQIRWVSAITPARYYIDIVRDAFLRGGGWPAEWRQIGALMLLGAALFTMAWRQLRRMQVKA